MTSNNFFECIEAHYKNKLPFVVYSKPNNDEICARLQQDSSLNYATTFTESGFVFSPFDDINKTVLISEDKSKYITCAAFNTSLEKNVENIQLNSDLSKAKAFHINLVKQGIHSIKTSSLKKVVLSRQETLSLSQTNPILIFKSLLKAYKLAFVYCWYHPKVGLWLGATPETLIKIEGPKFSIMALAGTQDYNGSLNVVWQNKEKQEQQFVTDFIINNLKPSVENFKVSDTETVRAGNLVHLKTIISAQLKEKASLKHIVEALHPTPAVCGVPKQIAKQFILKHENYNREFYTGFLGELNNEKTIAPRTSKRNIENRAYAIKRKSTQLYVNLRCMQLKDKEAIIYVGGGITKSSNANSEWEETVSKSLVIKNVL
ncbi:chorismate-binding protein [Algibacter sp. PT7-4]|uniref:chorismate-binding protein n=1 Tax=Algibacter ulvanivorans TaxID=3400999 RepID=UPI003AAD16F8